MKLDPKITVMISTKNRKQDLEITLKKISSVLNRNDVKCLIYDDGSTDGTSKFISENYPKIELCTNKISKGYIYCRNKMLNTVNTDFAISLDDDAHFITENPINVITDYFIDNPKVGLLGFRVFWSKNEECKTNTKDQPLRMQSYVGCAHVWRMHAWKTIANYPEWFIFYGEENFASYELYKKKWEIHYLPQVLVQHRVNIKDRKKDKDYGLRLRRSLCSGWSLYFVFFPYSKIPRLMAYSIYMQFKLKVVKGDFTALKSLILGLVDLLAKTPKNIKHRNALTVKEYNNYKLLKPAQIYWYPE
jgi:glycosyltransferase involved in cell wall biosynthesis